MRFVMASGLVVVLVLLSGRARAALTTDEQSAIAEAKAAVVEAATLYRQKRYKECGEKIGRAIDQLNALSESKHADLIASIRETHARAKRARQLLAKEGVPLPDLQPLVAASQLKRQFASAQLTTGEQSAMAEARAAIAEAATLYKQGKYEECGKVIARAIEQLNALSESKEADVIAGSRDLYTRAIRARQLLAKQGVSVPALKPLVSINQPQPQTTASGASGRRSRPSRSDSERSSPRNSGNVSFAKVVAPILVRRCGGCHIRDRKGDFSMASFASLLRGGESGETTIEPGKPERSYLIELVETGDMPPRGNLSEPDIQTLKDWVRAGAEYDGKDKAEELAGLVPGGMRGGPGGPGGRAGRGFGPGGPQRGRRRLGQRGGR